VWEYNVEGPVYGSFTLGDDGTIFIGSDSRHLYALTAAGKLKWASPKLEGVVWSAPAVSDDGRVFLGVVADTPMYASPPPPPPSPDPSSWPRTAALVSPLPTTAWTCVEAVCPLAVSRAWFRYAVNYGGRTMYAFNPDGTIAWSSVTGADVYSSPVLHNDLLIFGNDLGNVMALKQADGAVAWNISTALCVPIGWGS
jgi:outer membrane protein assembly factor BamB